MTKPECLPGDIFCVGSSKLLGKMINHVQKFRALDNHSMYTHTGIILDTDGKTMESLWKIQEYHLRHYSTLPVIIGRHKQMTPRLAEIGLKSIQYYMGRKYPIHRFFFHILPIAKHVPTGSYLMCCDLVMAFLYICNLVTTYEGYNVDDIADMIQTHKDFNIIFEDRLLNVT